MKRTKHYAAESAKGRLSWLIRYVVAVASVAVAVGLRLLVDPLIVQETPFLLILGAIVVSAWFGGLGPGLLAAALSAVATDYFFLDPTGSFSSSGQEAAPLVGYVLEAVVVSYLTAGLRRARESAESNAFEMQRHQQNLRNSEERYRAVVEQTAEGIFLLNVDTKRILEANGALQALIGYAPEEISHLTLYDVVAHDPESVDNYVRHILENEHYFVGERKYRHRDGSLVDVEVNASVISYGGKEIICVAARDITERKRAEAMLRRSMDSLLALYEAGQVLGSTLEPEQIGHKLLESAQRISNLSAACIDLLDEDQQLYTLHAVGSEDFWRWARSAPEARAARRAAFAGGEHKVFELSPEEGSSHLAGLCLPLRVRDRIVGRLEAYGTKSLADRENLETLLSLANQGASALENAWLYQELAERERELQELVGRIVVAQEEERRRVAYEVHDGLTQIAVAAHQRLQIFGEEYSPVSAQARLDLDEITDLVQRTVSEARRVIAGLRPTTLDDFGLAEAVRLQVEELRAAGYEAVYEETLEETRLPAALETALFRVVQEALTNVQKHAKTKRVYVTLGHRARTVRLEVRDRGCGFEPGKDTRVVGPGERVGLASMRERVALLGGDLRIHSRLNEGTSVVAEIPLPGRGEETDYAG
jgi:PAS domain S-box-containing protein